MLWIWKKVTYVTKKRIQEWERGGFCVDLCVSEELRKVIDIYIEEVGSCCFCKYKGKESEQGFCLGCQYGNGWASSERFEDDFITAILKVVVK